eukprot:3643330-Pyramimonas_sp.AAC.1
MGTLTSSLLSLSADALASTTITSLAESHAQTMSEDRPGTPTAADADKSLGTRDDDSRLGLPDPPDHAVKDESGDSYGEGGVTRLWKSPR